MLAQIPMLPATVVSRIVQRFGSLPVMVQASVDRPRRRGRCRNTPCAGRSPTVLRGSGHILPCDSIRTSPIPRRRLAPCRRGGEGVKRLTRAASSRSHDPGHFPVHVCGRRPSRGIHGHQDRRLAERTRSSPVLRHLSIDHSRGSDRVRPRRDRRTRAHHGVAQVPAKAPAKSLRPICCSVPSASSSVSASDSWRPPLEARQARVAQRHRHGAADGHARLRLRRHRALAAHRTSWRSSPRSRRSSRRPTASVRCCSTRAQSSTAASSNCTASASCPGDLRVPRFVLAELQTLADSADDNRRARGRRGLDLLSSLPDETPVDVFEIDYPETAQVDDKLMRLAVDAKSSIVTVDYNLAKVARVRGIEVLNLNDAAVGAPADLPARREHPRSESRSPARKPSRASAISRTARWWSCRAAELTWARTATSR